MSEAKTITQGVQVEAAIRELYWYDSWNNQDGNIAYVGADFNDAEMQNFKKEFKKSFKKKSNEDYIEYDDRFIQWLREVKGRTVIVLNRPDNGFGFGANL